jgi:uncharacterized protein YegP (UPF0339 family)
MSKFEVFEDKIGEWRFRLKANNGKIVAVSESYPSPRNAVRGTRAVVDAIEDYPEVVVLK